MELGGTEEARAERKWEVFRSDLFGAHDFKLGYGVNGQNQASSARKSDIETVIRPTITTTDSPSSELDDIPPLPLFLPFSIHVLLILILSLAVQSFFRVHTPVPPPYFHITPFLVRLPVVFSSYSRGIVLRLRVFLRWWCLMWCMRRRRRKPHLSCDLV